jgi:EAL and modified HD-GYP domain-containing signal transduction protein
MSAPEVLPILSSLFDRLVLQTAPIVSPTRYPVGVRLTCRPLDDAPFAYSEVVVSLGPVLAQLAPMPMLLAVPGATLDGDLGEMDVPPALRLEIPVAQVLRPESWPLLRVMRARGLRLALSGIPPEPLPADCLEFFDCSVIAHPEDRRYGLPDDDKHRRRIPFNTIDIESVADASSAFARGARAVIGWPVRDTTQVRAKGLTAEQSVILQIIQLVRREAPPHEIESCLKKDPALAFALLKLVNSPAFGVSRQITSFQQALMLLGYEKLQRWLGLLLVNGTREPEMAPLAMYSITRGFLLDHLQYLVPMELRDELFLTGAFSMLDRLTGKSFDELLDSGVLSAPTAEALTRAQGPMVPYLELAVLSEQNDPKRVERRLQRLGITPAQFNHAVLRTILSVFSATSAPGKPH